MSSPGPFRPRHLVLYDGVCGLCNRLVRWLLHADREEALGFASLQSPTARRLLEKHGKPITMNTLYVLAEVDSASPGLLRKSAAAVFLLEAVGRTRTSRLLAALPTGLRDWCYDRVAAHRYRLFGRHGSCPVPPIEHRHRFLDSARPGGALLALRPEPLPSSVTR